MPKDLKEETLKTETIYHGRRFNLQKRTVKLPTGRRTTREIIDHPGAVAIIPLLDKDTAIMIEQYRTAADKIILEIPAGTLDKDEDPEDCARRELHEETGYHPQNLKKIFTGYTAPGYSTEKMHIYLATGLTYRGQRPDEDETIRTKKIRIKDLKRMIEKGEIEDMKTTCSILRLILDTQNKPRRTDPHTSR